MVDFVNVEDITDKIKTVVADQARVCAIRTQNLEMEISRLTQEVKNLRDTMVQAQVDIAVQKTKIGLWAAVGGSIPVVVILIRDWIIK